MKSFVKLLAASAIAFTFAACSSSSSTSSDSTATDTNKDTTAALETITIGATSSPHGVILEEAKELLKEKGYELDIVIYDDYPNINPSTSDGSLLANYFQHQPYLDSYNADNNYEEGVEGYLVSAGAIHYEPFGIYSEKHDTLDVEEGAQIAIPDDATNEARALYLLQDQGWITLADDVSISTATVKDITDNPLNLDIIEVGADKIASMLPDVDYGVINGNYALTFEVTDKQLVTESEDSEAAQTYQNVIAVKEENKDDPRIVALVEVLKSDDIKNFIKEEFGAFAVPAQ